MTTSNVKITEVAEDPSKCKVTLSDLRAMVDRLESISPGSVREDIHLSISGGQLNVDYYYTPPVAVKEIQLHFKITKEGCEIKEHRPMCFDHPEMAGTTASSISDGETDRIREKNWKQFDDDYPPIPDFSMVKNPEPWAIIGDIEDMPQWAIDKRKRAAATLREFQSLLTETR